MSVGGPQLPPGQQGIDSSQPLSRPEEDSGKVKKEQYTPKEIGKKVFNLTSKALKFLSGHRSVQKVEPFTVQPTTGLKSTPVKPLPSTPIGERSVQPIDIPPNPPGNAPDLDDIDDGSHYARTEDLKPTVPSFSNDLEDEDQYQKVDIDTDTFKIVEDNNAAIDDTRNNSLSANVSRSNSDSGGDSKENSLDNERKGSPSQEPISDEPTTSSDKVKAKKYQAYQDILNQGDFGALDKKLANTNNYETAKTVAQMVLHHNGKDKGDIMFQIAQNRMQELKADQLFDELGGFVLNANYDEIREQAQEYLSNHYKGEKQQNYRNHVFEKLDTKLKEYETRLEGETPFSHLQPPLPPHSEGVDDTITSEFIPEASRDIQIDDEPPPLPERSEPLTKQKKRRGFSELFRRDR